MVYDIDSNGERIKLDIKPEELQNYSNPERVLIVIRKDLGKIYICKGSKAPVRKKFISSRVALDIQRDLHQKDRFYKIISIDQEAKRNQYNFFPKYNYRDDGMWETGHWG